MDAPIDANDPRELIFSFLSELPATIRTESLLWVIVYAIGIDVPDKIEDFQIPVRDYLLASGIRGIGAVICSAAVIDHTFVGLIEKLDDAEIVLRRIIAQKPDFPQQSLLSLPLRRRHWEQALATWKRLRSTKLSPEKIQEFATSQLRPSS